MDIANKNMIDLMDNEVDTIRSEILKILDQFSLETQKEILKLIEENYL